MVNLHDAKQGARDALAALYESREKRENRITALRTNNYKPTEEGNLGEEGKWLQAR